MPWHDLTKFPRSTKRCTVYLLHFSRPFGHAKHYVGMCDSDRDIEQRVEEHRTGQGAKLCRYAVNAGIELILLACGMTCPGTSSLS